ncbi:MAG TPA: hypothetical protein VLL98_00115 [Rickettsiales bacterium]|nr:hypothetical protein [Rickettsiales bacterium]
MTYSDRQHIITWTSPSGKSFELSNISNIEYSFKHYGNLTTIVSDKDKGSYDTLSFLNTNKNSGNSNGSDSNKSKGDIFEDLGISGKTIPLQIIFSGDNHDTESEKFESAFKELGESRLQLVYDRPIRVNAQTLSKKCDLVKDIASTIIEVEFIETLQNKPLAFTNKNLKNTLKTNIENQKELLIENFNTFSEATLSEKLQKLLNSITTNLTKLANTINNIANGDFDAILRDIQANLLNGTSSTLLQEISSLIDVGFEMYDSIPYITTLLNNIIRDITGNEVDSGDMSKSEEDPNSALNTDIVDQQTLLSNDFFISNLFLSVCDLITSANTNSTNTTDSNLTIETRKEATQTALTIQNLYTNYKTYYDIKYKLLDLNLEDITANSSNINTIIQSTVGLLIESSFNLKTEFNIELNQDSNLIDIAYRYYKDSFKNDPESTIDYIATTNGIKDDEFLLLPKGKNIVIYV